MAEYMEQLGESVDTEIWDDAYNKVEHYLLALQIKNRRILSKLVYLILEKAAARLEQSPESNPTILAMEETRKITTHWLASVLVEKFDEHAGIPTRGRLAMLLADVPNKWVRSFLADPPWPEEFISSMKKAYKMAGPDFQHSNMKHRALEFNPAGSILAETFRLVGRYPYFKWLIYIIVALVFICIFLFTR